MRAVPVSLPAYIPTLAFPTHTRQYAVDASAAVEDAMDRVEIRHTLEGLKCEWSPYYLAQVFTDEGVEAPADSRVFASLADKGASSLSVCVSDSTHAARIASHAHHMTLELCTSEHAHHTTLNAPHASPSSERQEKCAEPWSWPGTSAAPPQPPAAAPRPRC